MIHDVAIAVASHKPYWMPSDAMYIPVHAGALGREPINGFRSDAESDGGISALNPHLSELTVLYWAWRNVDADAVGIAHYRRHFSGSGARGTLASSEARRLLAQAPVVVPRARNYVIDTVGGHFDHTFDPAHLDLLVEVVAERSPGIVPVLRRRLMGTKGHMFNMMIMRRDVLDSYCSWMFPIVGAVESRMDYLGLTPFEARTPGRLAELLLDTWLVSDNVLYVECPIRNLEPVNWAKKGGSFLAARFTGRKYTRSF